ncbi:MAG: C4-type zinc ribbon domain-containing protein [Candidatus Omnitrophota bacterium]|nr:C4-type zinc ribbon domain-containing protein [Candidatus Omnitrophota bacterium]
MPEQVNIKEEIKKLIQVQELDAEIYDLSAEKGSFPGRLNEMDSSLEEKKGGMQDAEEELKKLQVSKSEKETDMQAKEEQINKHESELYQIKNNKEYKALQQEIDSIKADVSLLEEDIINLFDAIEAAQAKCEQEKKIFEDEKQKVEKEKETIKSEEKRLSERLNELTAKRKEFSGAVAPKVLQEYERILKSRGRIAIVKVNGEFCGECNIHLRPQVINEAKMKKNLVFCENCVRILYDED